MKTHFDWLVKELFWLKINLLASDLISFYQRYV